MTKLRLLRSWEDRLALGVLGAAAIALWWYGDSLPLKVQILLWAGLAAAVALLASQGWVNIFGPVLFYDLVRTGRRSRYILFRFVYALLLFAVLVQMHINWNIGARSESQQEKAKQMARMADQYFATFMTMQVIAVLLLTPAYTAGAVAEEKDRKTLEFILATDLEDREIILSKLVSRICSLTFVLLVSLPILGLMQFLGGVDPEMVVASYLATGLTMTSLASLSILASVYAKKTRDAVGRVYMGMIAYLTVLPILELFLKSAVPTIGAARLWFGESAPTLLDAVATLNHGNIFMAYFGLAMVVASGRSLATALDSVLSDYVTFHVLCTAICTTWAVLRLRAVASRQTGGPAARKSKALALREARIRRPPVGNRPMIWKELYAESGPRLNVLGRIVLAVLVISSFFPAGWIIYYFRYEVPYGMSNRDHFHQAINAWVRITGTVVACLLWLAIAVRASGSVTGERDRDTWDSLITTPLDSEPMYFAKWWGSICSVRWSLLWLGGLWAIGMILGGLQPIAIPLVIGAWCVLAGFFASVGMWFTTWCKTTGRATLTTMIVSLFCGGLHWFVLGMCCYMPLAWTVPGNWRFLRELTEFHAFGLTPPITLGWLAIEGDEFNHYPPDESPVKFMFYSFIGLTIWGVLALVLYVAGQERFRILSMRSFRGYPPRHEPAAADEARSWG